MSIGAKVARWNQFYNEWETGFTHYKPELQITVYGSYVPDSEKQLLLRMKNALISEGYIATKVVEDFPNSRSLNSFEISKACLEFSDVNFLVFTFDGKRFGVVRELTYCCSPQMIDRRWRCVSFEQKKGERTWTQPGNRSHLHSENIVRPL